MRTLLLFTTVGGGHRSAARALAEAFRDLDPGGTVEAKDVLEFTPAVFRRIYQESYAWLVNHTPEVWGYLYEHAAKPAADRKKARLVRAFDRLNYRRLLEYLERFAPDAVVGTHFLPTEILVPLAERGEFHGRYWVVLTDHDAHGLWIRRGPRGFFTGSDEVRVILEAAGIDPARIRVTGIPVSKRFRALPAPAEARIPLGLPPSARVALLMSGGFGFGEVIPFAKALSTIEGARILAVAGHNEDLERELMALARERPAIIPFGFVSDIERLFAAADVVVTKSGGLTTSECLAAGKPMIVIRPTPGQEERNADYLLENGAAWRAQSPEILRWKAERLWREPERLQALTRAARALGRPDAAQAIARKVIGALGEGRR
ncbi:MAG: glycosyltransferase [Planctomycetes bacterium]|nr:glycosyltransferase [Planctomycetota bacterium]